MLGRWQVYSGIWQKSFERFIRTWHAHTRTYMFLATVSNTYLISFVPFSKCWFLHWHSMNDSTISYLSTTDFNFQSNFFLLRLAVISFFIDFPWILFISQISHHFKYSFLFSTNFLSFLFFSMTSCHFFFSFTKNRHFEDTLEIFIFIKCSHHFLTHSSLV